MANPFDVRVVNPLEALMYGEQGYKDMRGYQDDRTKRDARMEAQQALASGGDTKGALAKLIGVGDYQGVQALGALGKADTTDEIKEYNLAKQQGFQGSFVDFKTGIKRAGATRINNSISTGENEYFKKLGAADADRFIDFQKTGRTATQTQGVLDRMEALVDNPEFYSGAGGEKFILPLKKTIGALGGNPDAAAPMEEFRALSNKAALEGMGGSLGTGFSNADRDFIVNQYPNLDNTRTGNKARIEGLRAIERRKSEIAKRARDYASRNRGRLDAGFDEELAQWAEQNPLFPRGAQAPSSGGAPNTTQTGVPWRIVP